jgi:2-hydroxychromene-2-carboxylate isomerase
MTLQLDIFWSFRSPYSYLVMPRIMELRHQFDVEIQARVVYPLAVRDPKRLKNMHPMFLNYMLLDTRRLADYLGMPIASPHPDPVDFDIALDAFAGDQPRVTKLMRLGVVAAERGRGLEFIDAMSQMIFGGMRDWDTHENMQRATAKAGLELDEIEAAIADDPARLDRIIDSNHQAQQAAGHWGVPLMVFNGEPFFGQDRFDQLVWRMRQHQLSHRE